MKTPHLFNTKRGASRKLIIEIGLSMACGIFGLAAQPLVFQPPVTYPAGIYPFQMVAADFNGDLVADFAAVNFGVWPTGNGSVSVYLGNGNGGFPPQASYTAGVIPMGIATGDFNEDGSPDLFTVNRTPAGPGGSLSVFLNRHDGSGTFLSPSSLPSGSQPMNAAAGYLNADTHLDIAVAVHGSNAVQILLGNGDGTFSQPNPLISVGVGPNGVVIADINNDGVQDVAISNWWSDNVSVLLGNGDGTFVEKLPRSAIGPRSWNLAAGDFDHDGKVDLAVPSALVGTLSILRGVGDGSFQPQLVMPVGGVGNDIYNLSVADMDGDGSLDIVAAANGLRIFKGNGNATFQPPQVFGAPAPAMCSAVADFNGDGAPDVVVGTYAGNSASVFLQVPPNHDPVANAGPDQTVECLGNLTPVELDGSSSSDPDGDSLTYGWSVASDSGAVIDDPSGATPTGWFPDGTTMVTLTVSDGHGGFDTDDMLVIVHDTAAPVVVCTTDIASLWPPNHRMVPVSISLSITDACTSPGQFTVSCAVSSSEPDEGKGDGKTKGDVNGANGYISPVPVTLVYQPTSGLFTGVVNLRAERDGSKYERTYSITSLVGDSSGNKTTATCVVVVPRDMGRK